MVISYGRDREESLGVGEGSLRVRDQLPEK